jgi:hypothetical protein
LGESGIRDEILSGRKTGRDEAGFAPPPPDMIGELSLLLPILLIPHVPLGQQGAALENDVWLFLISLSALLVIFFCVWLLFRDYFQWRQNMMIALRRARQPLLIVVIVRKVFGKRAKVEKVIAGQLDEDFSPAALRRQISRTLAEPVSAESEPESDPTPPAAPAEAPPADPRPDPRLF